MPERDLIDLVTRPLHQAEIPHFISGSVAAMFYVYGEPPVTHDINLIVFLATQDVSMLAAIFPTPTFYVPPSEANLKEISPAQPGHFKFLHLESGLKAHFYPGRDELHAWAFQHARRSTVSAAPVSLAPPEYVILRKLQYFREGGSEKHLRDIRSMLAVSGEQLDRAALDHWLDRLGLNDEWRRVTL